MDIEKDTKTLLQFIEGHVLEAEIVSMFLKGPPADTGWTFYPHNTPGFTAIEQEIVRLNYDSSGFTMMMRRIEYELSEIAKAKALCAVRAVATNLDEANEKAFCVLETEGSAAAAAHMMKAAGGDYSTMRSMFG
jgi:hypothetical protein